MAVIHVLTGSLIILPLGRINPFNEDEKGLKKSVGRRPKGNRNRGRGVSHC